MGLGNLNPGCNCCGTHCGPVVLCESGNTVHQLVGGWSTTQCTVFLPFPAPPQPDGSFYISSGRLTSNSLKAGAYWQVPFDEQYCRISIECDYEVVLSGTGSDLGYTGLWIGAGTSSGWWVGLSRQNSLQFKFVQTSRFGCPNFSGTSFMGLGRPDKVPIIGHISLIANKLINGNWWIDFCMDAPDDGTYIPFGPDLYKDFHIARFETSGNPFGDPINLGVRFFTNFDDATSPKTYYDNIIIKISRAIPGPSPASTGFVTLSIGHVFTEIIATFANPSYTASITNTIHVSTAIAATRTKPTYAATITNEIGGLTTAINALFAVDVFLATISTTVGHIGSSIVATRTVPTFTASITPSVGHISTTISATHTKPVFSASISTAVGHVATSITTTFTKPTFGATITTSVGHIGTTIAATRTVPIFSGSVVSIVGHVSTAITATFTKPSYTASIGTTTGHIGSNISATHTKPTFASTIANTIGHIDSDLAATFVVHTYAATIATSVGHISTVINATHTKPTYAGVLVSMIGHVDSDLNSTFVKPTFSSSVVSTLGHTATIINSTFTPKSTATITSSVGHVSTAIAATRTKPTYAAAITTNVGHISTVIVATRTKPTYASTLVNTIGHISTVITATFSLPVVCECTWEWHFLGFQWIAVDDNCETVECDGQPCSGMPEREGDFEGELVAGACP